MYAFDFLPLAIRHLWADERAQGLSEQGILLAIIAVGCLAVFTVIAATYQDFMNGNAQAMDDALSSVSSS